MHADTRRPAVRERRDLLVALEHLLQTGTAEQPQHREVRLPVPAVRGRVDEPDPSVGRPQHIAAPQVAVQPRGRLRRSRQLRQPLAQPLHDGRLTGPERALVDRPPQIRQHTLPGVPARPVGAGFVAHRREPDVRVHGAARRRRPERRRPGGVQRREVPPEPHRRLGVRPPVRDPVDDQPALLVPVHRRHPHACGGGQPPQPRRLGPGRPRRVAPLDDHDPSVVQGDFGEGRRQRPFTADRPPGEPGDDFRTDGHESSLSVLGPRSSVDLLCGAAVPGAGGRHGRRPAPSGPAPRDSGTFATRRSRGTVKSRRRATEPATAGGAVGS